MGRRPPSGLFPGRQPTRPTYREPVPVSGGLLTAGLGAATLWMILFGLLGSSLAGYAWWTVIAGTIAWAVAVALLWYGDRGTAAGVAVAVGFCWSIAAAVVALRWAISGNWPLW